MIELVQVCPRLPNSRGHEPVSLRIETGEYAVLMGPSGSGKTTLLETICGLRPIASGRILLDGRDFTHAAPAQRQIGYVPQDLALFPFLTVREQLEFALRLRPVSAADRTRRIDELAQLLEIAPLLPRRMQGLSGGEAQRVALGRALSFQPPLLLLDEPLSALDESLRTGMQNLLQAVQRSTGVTVLHVTHHPEEAHSLSQRLFRMNAGSVRELPLSGTRS